MPKVNDTPAALRPFVSQGLVFASLGGHDGHAAADCIFCGKADKFRVNAENGLWDCKKCLESGNAVTFLRKLWQVSFDSTKNHDDLAADRRLLYGDTPAAWGAARSVLTDEWLIPGYGAGGKLDQLYRYSPGPDGRRVLKATAEVGHGLFGVNLFDPSKPDAYLCEGPWDGMALWEALRLARRDGDRIVRADSEAESLLATANVLAAPGCGSFDKHWCTLFAGKRVFLMYDNDHPRTHPKTGAPVEAPARAGMRKAAGVLAAAKAPPSEVFYLDWSEKGDDHEPSLQDGFDVRDWLSASDAPDYRAEEALPELLRKLRPAPADWAASAPAFDRTKPEPLTCAPCDSWKTLLTAWKKAMKWTEGLDRALAVMLACVTSTRAVGDQLWVKVMGPPSCGKTNLCEAVSVNTDYVVAKSTVRGFHSGYKSDPSGKEDNSLVAKLYDKTLVTKDGDALLQSPNLGQILAEARDLYDMSSRTHYRNRMSKDYAGVRMTWILCGTSSLRLLDSSELGERFLDCLVMEGIDEGLEDEILWRVANRTERGMSMEANGKMETQYSPEMVAAMRLTGGYVGHLRENARDLLAAVSSPEDALRACTKYGKFVAFLRARPSPKQDEAAEREIAARLVSQLVRLAKCLAVVLNRPSLDAEVMRRVRQTALDTARGRSMNIMKLLARPESVNVGMETGEVCHHTGFDEVKERRLLKFLRDVGALRLLSSKMPGGVKGRPRWHMSPAFRALYQEVVGDNRTRI